MIPWHVRLLLPKRRADFVIGSPDHPYLLRWWLIRNRFFNVYLHHIRRDDDDRALHDHPWWNVSILLRGAYEEITPRGTVRRQAPCVVFRRATDAHRLKLPIENGGIRYVWSLFITGPRVREWGFICPQGWRVWHEFVDARDKGRIGRGCE